MTAPVLQMGQCEACRRRHPYERVHDRRLFVHHLGVNGRECTATAVPVGTPPDPTAALPRFGACCPASKPSSNGHTHFCTRERGHDGDHIAGDGQHVRSIWSDALEVS